MCVEDLLLTKKKLNVEAAMNGWLSFEAYNILIVLFVGKQNILYAYYIVYLSTVVYALYLICITLFYF
jgi:hypothetical protein